MTRITIPISLGELIDKLTILEIKISNIVDENKNNKVKREHHLLMQVVLANEIPINQEPLASWIKDLHSHNEKIWNAENILRQQQSKGLYKEKFQEAAQDAFMYNMKRHEVKQNINNHYNSDLTEEKQYG